MSDAFSDISLRTLSRSLLVPGPQPPLSHLGASLMRHVVGTVVRYSLYQLGLPMPDGPPVRILRLRVFLDAVPLAAALRSHPGGAEVMQALLLPGGAGELDSSAGRVRAAASLHRARLAAFGPRRGRVGAGAAPAGATRDAAVAAASGQVAGAPGASSTGEPTSQTREQLWAAVGAVLSGQIPYLCDAALGELVTSLGRRRLRHRGNDPGGALGLVAMQAHQGRAPDLTALGALDPMAPSWAESSVAPDEISSRAQRARADAALPKHSGRRGGFREAYRWVLSELRPLMVELGNRGVAEGIVDASDDVFFIPFDLGVELAAPKRPSWLTAAVGANRREHMALSLEPEHADSFDVPPALAPLHDRSADWDITPLRLVE